VARRKIDSGANVVEGKQTAPNMKHDSNKVFQDGAVSVPNKGPFRTLFSRVFRTHRIPDSPPSPSTSALSLHLRRLVFAVACVFVYVLLDRTTVYLQIWPSISAWYPPVGLSVALIVGLGLRILPVLAVAGYLAGVINYHQSVTGLPFLLLQHKTRNSISS
jgi:hypothetical protein